MKKQDKNLQLFFSLASFIFFIYVSYRAYSLSITWDEAFSYLEFTRSAILFPITYNGMSANNHLLNTWLTFITTSLFGNSELCLRLPNLLAYALFLFFNAKFASEFCDRLFSVSAFLILNLNPYLVDFFSLSRGYGLSYGLLTGSLWYLYLFFNKNFSQKHGVLSMLFAITAGFAHLTLIYFVLTLFCILIGTDFIFISRSIYANTFRRILLVIKKNSVQLIMLLLYLIIIIPLGNNLRKAGALFYGGNNGFWTDTIKTVINRSLYEKPYAESLTSALSILCVLVFLATFIFLIIKGFKKGSQSPSKYFLYSLVVILSSCILATIIQRHLFNTLYLMERTALFLLLLFSFIFIFLFAELSDLKIKYKIVAPLVAGFMLFHFINCLNFYYVLEWKWDADTKLILNDVENLWHKNQYKNTFDLGTTLELEQPINYYKVINNLTWLNEIKRTKDLTQPYDACIVLDMDFRKLNADSFLIIKNYPFINNKLIRYRPKL